MSTEAYLLNLTPIKGRAGDVRIAFAFPDVAFKGEKLVAHDSEGGRATWVRQIAVNGKDTFPPPWFPWWVRALLWLRRRAPPRGGLLTAGFAAEAVGNGLSLPACPRDGEIAVEVEFLVDAAWDGHLYGRVLR